MFERFTERARQVVVLAQDEARALKHNYIGTEHILLGLLREEEGLAARVLESLDITVEEVRAQVARIVGQGDEVTTGQIPFTPRAKKVLELALREALSLGHNYIGTEHILLGLVRENEGVAARILLDFDADAEMIRSQTLALLGPKEAPRGERVVLPSQGDEQTAWKRCAKCDGSAFAGRHCLAHANESERKAAMAAIGRGAAIDLRGVEIAAAFLESVLSAAPMSEGHVVLKSALFDGAIFPAGTSFERVIFNGVSFKRARFGARSSDLDGGSRIRSPTSLR